MSKFVFGLLLFIVPVYGQTASQSDRIRKDATQLQTEVNDLVNAGVSGIAIMQSPKAAYLDGYGLVVSFEVALERPRNPFSSERNSADLRTVVTERRKQIQEKLTDFLKKRVSGLESLGAAESLAVVVHFMNTNPADLPNMPSQLILSAKKQDAASGRIQVREF